MSSGKTATAMPVHNQQAFIETTSRELRAFYAPTSDPSHARPDEDSYPGDSLAAFAGVVAGRCWAGHDGPHWPAFWQMTTYVTSNVQVQQGLT
jgi:hypothetical protein